MKHCITNKESVIDHITTEITSPNDCIDEITTALLGRLYRVVEINCKSMDGNRFFKNAVLLNGAISFKVSWVDNILVNGVNQDDIVSIRALLPLKSNNGCVEICKLVKYQQPVSSVNLFDTIPHNWVKNRDLVKKGC